MGPASDAIPHEPRSARLLAALFAISIAIALGAVWSFQHSRADQSLFTLSNLVGPTTQSLLQGEGLTTCTEAMGTPHNPICFHAARMPLPSLIVGLGITLFGNHYLRVAFFKALLLLLPLELALYFAWRRTPRSTGRRRATALLLLAPFAIFAFLANVVNLQVEEGYAYSLLALAVAILFFAISPARKSIPHALLFALALDGVYLTKSALAPAVIVLLIGYLLLERRPTLRLLVLILTISAPIGWALHQHHASGRYSIGTSLDGINLHKGNNSAFLEHYPPAPGDTLDRFDSQLNQGQHFADEWSFNDYHRHAALDYIRTHPRQTLQAAARKLKVLFFSTRKIGSTEDHGATRLAEFAGLALFRLILWTAILSAACQLFRSSRPQRRILSGIFLALIAACALPYLAGFAYTRHASILIYPAALMCCRLLSRDEDVGEQNIRQSLRRGKGDGVPHRPDPHLTPQRLPDRATASKQL